MNEVAGRTPATGASTSSLRDAFALAVAVLLSAAILWFASGQVLVVAGFIGAVAVLGALVRLVFKPRNEADAPELAVADWSVTHVAIDHPGIATAITDRAGRLVCASASFAQWFGPGATPPLLAVDRPSQERLDIAARAAWRDGEGAAQVVGTTGTTWSAQVRRAGRGEDYLVWWFAPLKQVDLLADMAAHISGKLGRALAAQGIQAALVTPDGSVRAVNQAFVLRATGDPAADITGADFVGFLCADEQERIFYAREGGKGTPLRLIHVPVADPDASVDADTTQVPSLMLLIDNIGGMGDVRTGIPQIEALLARLPLGIAMTDRDGRFLFANDAFLRAAGHRDSTVPPYPSDLVIREDKGAIADAVRRYAQGAPTRGDVAVRLLSAPDEPVSLSLAGVRGLGEGAVLLSLKDSTEETRLKREIAQATKMQAVGQLAGGVAHDFNNVLTAIIGYCDLMLMRHTPGDSDYDDIQQIKANSNRAASLTRQLLAFSRQQTLRPQVLQLPDVVSEVSALLKRLIGEKIQLVVTHDRNLGPVRADPVQLEQVLLNLAVNARDAIQAHEPARGAGKVSLTTRRITASHVRAMKSEILPMGDYTALIVEDNGCGIRPDYIGKIFEPFFTTKDKGKGTGLGLSTVYGIVKQSGGFIFADSEPGQGTRFTIYLPVHVPHPNDAEQPQRRNQEPPREWSGGGRILLVEDEDTVRAVAERALSRQGYEVSVAADGEEGLEQVRSGGQFDLIVSDVVMPTMDGPAMAREIRKIYPEIPIVFMSGYAEEQLRKEIDVPNMHFLAKPFSVQQIAETVENVLRAAL